METRTNENIVSSFFYYMWNMWCKEECIKIFDKVMGEHFWHKWENAWEQCKGPWGATELLYSEMSSEYKKMLVSRALECYDGMHRINGNGEKK